MWRALDECEAGLAALRGRLAATERALGLPGPRHGAAPPDLPLLHRRVAALERRAGLIPGLAPLAELGGAAPPATVEPAHARSRRQVWRDHGGALLVMLLLALLAWLFRPPGLGTAVGPTSEAILVPTASSSPVAAGSGVAATPGAPAPSWSPCAWVSGERCPADTPLPVSPMPLPGETPCPLGGSAPCGADSVVSSPPITPCAFADDRGIPGEGCVDR